MGRKNKKGKREEAPIAPARRPRNSMPGFMHTPEAPVDYRASVRRSSSEYMEPGALMSHGHGNRAAGPTSPSQLMGLSFASIGSPTSHASLSANAAGRRSQGSFDLSGRTTRTSYSAPPPLPGNHPTFPKGFQLPPAPPGGVTSFASAINSNPIGARRTSNPLHNAGLAPQNDEYLDPRTSQLGLERRGSTSSGAYGFDAGTTSVGGYDSASLFAAGETEYDNFDGQRQHSGRGSFSGIMPAQQSYRRGSMTGSIGEPATYIDPDNGGYLDPRTSQIGLDRRGSMDAARQLAAHRRASQIKSSSSNNSPNVYAAFSGMYNDAPSDVFQRRASVSNAADPHAPSSFGIREYDPLYDDPPPNMGGGGGRGVVPGAMTVVIPKPLGLTLKNLPESSGTQGTFISKVKEGSNAAMTGRITSRMLVVSIGGMNVQGAKSSTVANQIRAMPSPVHIGLLPMYD